MTELKWWETAVLYQIYPRSFQDSNSDGIGDLPGITTRLDYIANLGVDAIWISPFYPSPQKDFGYDVSDYCDINPEYGTLADFDALIAKAQELPLDELSAQISGLIDAAQQILDQDATRAIPADVTAALDQMRQTSHRK